MVTSFETVFFTFAFIVPGFIMSASISFFIPSDKDYNTNALVKYLYFSSLNYALWAWLIYYMIKKNLFEQYPLLTAVLWGLIILISPTILGIALGVLLKKETLGKVFYRIGLNVINPTPTAWDDKFSTLKNGWVIITLKDGSTVAGDIGVGSCISTDKNERDIYLKKIYRINEDGKWCEVDRTDGILITGNQIKHIEFFK